MKKRVICFLVALCTVIPMIFSGCSSDGDSDKAATRKALTLTLYGITGESTTDEAVQLVEDAMNEYTEGQFNTHIELHLYTEDEYYGILDAKLAEQEEEAARQKENKRNAAKNGKADDTAEVDNGEDVETYVEYGEVKSVYPEETAGQVDIFMVRGGGKLGYYYDKGRLADLTDTLSASSGGVAKILNSYISADMFATVTFDGKTQGDGTVTSGTIGGIPNNSVSGEYTYLLINKELATKYYYSADDINTLETLAYFLDDVKTNDKDYIPLYNEPVLNLAYLTDEPSLIGGTVSNDSLWYQSTRPRDMMPLMNFMSFYTTLSDYKKAGYITKGEYDSLPEGEKIAAAFLKGDASIPTEYGEEYYVVTYAKPIAKASERPGTVFCVSANTANVNRAMEIICALQTETSFRDTFQYGAKDVHYEIDEFTDEINIISDEYSMNPADTGNMFILSPNSSMDEKTAKLAANNWELAKQQYRDTITGPYCMFDLRIVTKDNFRDTSYIYEEDFEKAKKKQGSSFDAEKFASEYKYDKPFTDDILNGLTKISKEIFDLLDKFEEHRDSSGKLVDIKTYIRDELVPMLEEDENGYYAALTDKNNPDSPYSQYMAWVENVDPTA